MDEILDEKTYETRNVQYAGFILRTAAFIADLLIFIMFCSGLYLAFRPAPSFYDFIILYWWKILPVVLFYFIYFDGSESNATPGKQIMNIRLLSIEKKEIDFTISAKHFVLSILLFFGYFMLLNKNRFQTLADKISHVIVIKK